MHVCVKNGTRCVREDVASRHGSHPRAYICIEQSQYHKSTRVVYIHSKRRLCVFVLVLIRESTVTSVASVQPTAGAALRREHSPVVLVLYSLAVAVLGRALHGEPALDQSVVFVHHVGDGLFVQDHVAVVAPARKPFGIESGVVLASDVEWCQPQPQRRVLCIEPRKSKSIRCDILDERARYHIPTPSA